MPESLFVYGTLKDPKVQKEVIISREISGETAVLNDYAKSEIGIDGQNYPVLVPKKGSSVDGIMLNLRPEELARIDEYETEAYKRELVKLDNRKEAWSYLSVN